MMKMTTADENQLAVGCIPGSKRGGGFWPCCQWPKQQQQIIINIKLQLNSYINKQSNYLFFYSLSNHTLWPSIKPFPSTQLQTILFYPASNHTLLPSIELSVLLTQDWTKHQIILFDLASNHFLLFGIEPYPLTKHRTIPFFPASNPLYLQKLTRASSPLGGYLLKPGTLYGSQFVHLSVCLSISLSLSLSLCMSLSVTFPWGIVDGQTFFDGQSFKLVLFETCFCLRY